MKFRFEAPGQPWRLHQPCLQRSPCVLWLLRPQFRRNQRPIQLITHPHARQQPGLLSNSLIVFRASCPPIDSLLLMPYSECFFIVCSSNSPLGATSKRLDQSRLIQRDPSQHVLAALLRIRIRIRSRARHSEITRIEQLRTEIFAAAQRQPTATKPSMHRTTASALRWKSYTEKPSTRSAARRPRRFARYDSLN